MPRAGTVYGIGDVFPSMRAPDQFGSWLPSTFYGNVILVDFSAGWCGLQTVASSAEAHFNDYWDQGFVVVHAMIDDYSGREAPIRPSWPTGRIASASPFRCLAVATSMAGVLRALCGRSHRWGHPYMLPSTANTRSIRSIREAETMRRSWHA